MTDERVHISVADAVAEVALNRPDKRNALDGPMFDALIDAGERLKAARGVRAVVLHGNGPSFCAGLDTAAFADIVGGHVDGVGSIGSLSPSGVTHRAQQVAWVWQELEVPVIASLAGHALGGGLQIALGADIRVAHPATKLSVREIYWGLVPDMTGTLMLASLVRADVAKELTLTGRIVTADEGYRLGLVTELSDDPLTRARALAAEVAARNPDAVRATKRLFARLYTGAFVEQFAAERAEIGRIFGSSNQIEAVMANLEDRPPNFSDPP